MHCPTEAGVLRGCDDARQVCCRLWQIEALEAALAEQQRAWGAKEARHKLTVERLRRQVVELQVCARCSSWFGACIRALSSTGNFPKPAQWLQHSVLHAILGSTIGISSRIRTAHPKVSWIMHMVHPDIAVVCRTQSHRQRSISWYH